MLLWMTNKDLQNGYKMEHLKHFGDEPSRSFGVFVRSETDIRKQEVFTYVSILSLRQSFVWGSLLNGRPEVFNTGLAAFDSALRYTINHT